MSRDPNRIARITGKLGDYWELHPDLRFNQLIQMIMIETQVSSKDFYQEDDETESIIEDL